MPDGDGAGRGGGEGAVHTCPGNAPVAPVVASDLPGLQQHSRPSAEATQRVYWVMDPLMRAAEPSAAPAPARDSETLVSALFYARVAVSSAPPAAACTAASCSSNTFVSPEHPPEIQNENRAALRDWEHGLLCEIKGVPNSVLSHSCHRLLPPQQVGSQQAVLHSAPELLSQAVLQGQGPVSHSAIPRGMREARPMLGYVQVNPGGLHGVQDSLPIPFQLCRVYAANGSCYFTPLDQIQRDI